MTHADYLEQHHEIVTKVLPTVRLRLSKGEHDAATNLFWLLDKRLSDLWTQRQETAQREVAP